MNTLYIPQSELGEKNIFEEIFELLERHRLNYESNFPLGNFYDVINNFDICFQKFNFDEKIIENIVIYNDLLNYTVRNFLTIFKSKGFRNERIFFAFKRFIAFFSKVLEEANSVKPKRDIIRNFLENFPSLQTDISQFEEAAQVLYTGHYYGQKMTPEQKSISKFESDFPADIGMHTEGIEYDDQEIELQKPIIIYCNDFVAKNVIWNRDTSSYDVVSQQFYLILEILVDTSENSVENYSLHFGLLLLPWKKLKMLL